MLTTNIRDSAQAISHYVISVHRERAHLAHAAGRLSRQSECSRSRIHGDCHGSLHRQAVCSHAVGGCPQHRHCHCHRAAIHHASIDLSSHYRATGEAFGERTHTGKFHIAAREDAVALAKVKGERSQRLPR